MRNAFRWSLLLACCVAFGVEAAEPVTTPEIHARVEKIRTERNIPAAAVLIARGDQVLLRDAWGTVAAGSAEPVTVDDAWHIGSDTKAMTATLAARLIEAGKLKWTTNLGEACPALKGKIHADWEATKLEDLLTQSAGVPAAIEGPVFLLTLRGLEGNAKLSPRQRRAELLTKMLTAPPPRKPGEKFEYANLNFIIAGHMLEAICDADWEDLVRREVFEPLGMKSAAFGPPPRVRGHALGQPLVMDNSSVMGPAGTVHLAFDDWLKFARVHLGLVPGFLQKASIEKMHVPALDRYAMGWLVIPRKDGSVSLAHDGSNTIFYARIIVRPSDGVIVLAAVSTADGGACDAVATAAAAVLEPATRPTTQGREPDR